MRAYNARSPRPRPRPWRRRRRRTPPPRRAPSDESKSKSKRPPRPRASTPARATPKSDAGARNTPRTARPARQDHRRGRRPPPAGVTAAAAAARTRARPPKTTGASLGPSPGVPWRVNANVARDVTDPISVAFAEAKRVKALEEARDARAAAARKRSSGGGGSKTRRPSTFRVSAVGAVEPARTVPRRSYPNFRDWLAAQTDLDAANAARDARLRAQREAMPAMLAGRDAPPGSDRAASAVASAAADARLSARAANAAGLKRADADGRLTVPDAAHDAVASAASPPPRVGAVHRSDGIVRRRPGVDGRPIRRARGGGEGARGRRAGGGGGGGVARGPGPFLSPLRSARRRRAERHAEAAYEDDALMRLVEEMETPKKGRSGSAAAASIGAASPRRPAPTGKASPGAPRAALRRAGPRTPEPRARRPRPREAPRRPGAASRWRFRKRRRRRR